jgi:Fic family protein
MEETCRQLGKLWDEGKISKLLLIPSFVFDFLCIHPFADGNGRISRLLTVLLLHKAGYEVGRYISLERIIEDSKEAYYDVLHRASEKWHEGNHNVRPWWEYFLGTVISAYSELEERVGVIIKGRGAKTNLVQSAVENMPSEFGISDVERACPSVGRDMIRVVLNGLRKSGKLRCTGAGRAAKWSKK